MINYDAGCIERKFARREIFGDLVIICFRFSVYLNAEFGYIFTLQYSLKCLFNNKTIYLYMVF